MTDAAGVAFAEATLVLQAAAVVAFLILVDDALNDAYDEFEQALTSMKDNADRQLAISTTLKDLWIKNQNATKLKALCETIAMTIPTRSESAAYGLFHSVAQNVGGTAVGVRNRLAKQYNVCGIQACDRTLDASIANASSNAAYAFYRAGQRRTDRRTQAKRKAVQTAHASSFVDPGPIFGLMNTASQMDQAILQGAYSHLSGAAAIGGMGLGALASSFGSGATGGNAMGTSSSGASGNGGPSATAGGL